MKENINYDIEKELENIRCRMHGTHFEQDCIIISDAIDLIREYKKLKECCQDGMKAAYEGSDESDDILCPMCGYSLARNDDYEEMRPKHCPECGTKIIYKKKRCL